jgi:GNAT superfamily N-acetyltransferase
MPVGPLAVIDETSLSLSVHVMEQTRADFAAEGKTYTATPGELLVERMVKEFKRAGRAAGGGFYDYPEGQKSACGPSSRPCFEKPGVAWNLQDVKDRMLYRQAVETARCLSRRRADHGARRQHRLDLRHRLPGLDRRCHAVHLQHGRGRLELNGERVGSVFVVRKSKTVAQLRMLILTPPARGLGLGARLTDECLAFARGKGYRKMVLWTNANLTPRATSTPAAASVW